MRMRFFHRDDSAWEMGDLAYELGDTIEVGATKARRMGMPVASDSYAAFMTAFSRRVRSKQPAPKREMPVDTLAA